MILKPWERQRESCLKKRIREENAGKGDARSGAPKAHPSQSDDHEMSDDKRSNDREKKKESQAPSDGAATGTPEAADEGDTSKQDPKSSSKESENTLNRRMPDCFITYLANRALVKALI